MGLSKPRIAAIGVLGLAMGIGYAMQSGWLSQVTGGAASVPLAAQAAAADAGPALSDLIPVEPAPQGLNQRGEILRARSAAIDASKRLAPVQESLSAFGIPCTTEFVATPQAGGLVRLSLDAPCFAGHPVTLKHGELKASWITNGEGQAEGLFPAFEKSATFIARFDDGTEISTEAMVPEAENFHRVGLQWVGRDGMGIHARAFGADYGERGHVFRQRPGGINQPERGFLMTLGNPNVPGGWRAEVFSFPVESIDRTGTVRLTVEAEVSSQTCGRTLDATSFQPDETGALSAVALSLSMPECDGQGGYLVLKNVLRDLKIASK